MQYQIYPPIGIARIGNDLNQFYIGPEIPGHPGFESDGQTPVQEYKVDEDQIKRQAARFRIFEIPDANTAPRPINLPAGATVEWTVHLVNKKGAVIRGSVPPAQPTRPQPVPNSADRLIDPKAQTIAGANAAAVKFDTGEFLNRRVPLGEIRTDQQQNLLVLGGFGFSSSPNTAPLPDFYTNPGWHDDVSDGPITARIRLSDGTTIANIAPAWVIVAPPDFAPAIQGVVTLYDIILQVAVDNFGVQPPAHVSFTNHVFPVLQRTRQLRWVNNKPTWSDVSDNWPVLADTSGAASQLRTNSADAVRNIESVLSDYSLTSLQKSYLDKWEAGNFLSDWTGVPQPGNNVTADGLTRAALDSTVGQGFFPGIEGGILAKDPTLYSTPFDFRLDHGQAQPGDLTSLMAVPWQADFNDCLRGWWPSQRPDDVRANPNATTTVRWERGVSSHIGMINNFSRLGFITAQRDAQGNIVFAEDQRAPTIQFV